MPIFLPRQVHPAAFKHIAEESDKREKYAMEKGGMAWQEFSADVQAQNEFLEAFAKTFSVTRSIKATGISNAIYNRWKATSIHFVVNFNQIIEQWHDDIYTSAATRARGYLISDDSTGSGFKEDASGQPVYYDADSSLTKMFLKAFSPEHFNEKVDMNLSGGLNNSTRVIKVRGVAPPPVPEENPDSEEQTSE